MCRGSPLKVFLISSYSKLSSPPFGSNAAGSACDGTVNMRQVGVVPCVVPGTNLKAREGQQKSTNKNIQLAANDTQYL